MDLAIAGAAVVALTTLGAAAALGIGFLAAVVAGLEVLAMGAEAVLAVAVLAVAAFALVVGAVCDAGLTPAFMVAEVAGLPAGAGALVAGFAVAPCDHAVAAASTRTEIV